jgi:hypothetical protein
MTTDHYAVILHVSGTRAQTQGTYDSAAHALSAAQTLVAQLSGGTVTVEECRRTVTRGLDWFIIATYRAQPRRRRA